MTTDLAKLRADTLALIEGTTPGPWEKVTQAGDWGLVGGHLIQPHNCPEPYDNFSAIAVIEFETPYPTGSSRKERDSARQAEDNANLIAAAPTLAADTLRLIDENEARDTEIERLRDEIYWLRDILERIKEASRYWSKCEASLDEVQYAHETTARLADISIVKGEKDGQESNAD